MKTNLFTASLFCAFLVSGCGEQKKPVENAEPKKDTTAAVKEETPTEPVDSATMMKAWMDYSTPGDKHKWLADQSGKWSGEIKMWNAPDAPPTVSAGSADYKMILDGRYQESVHKSTFDGMPFEGKSTMAYDNKKQIFLSTWVDNMGTGIMVMTGKWDEATKTMTLEGTMVDPVTGKDLPIKEICTFPDAKTQTMEMYCTDASGKEMKTMEMKMTKK